MNKKELLKNLFLFKGLDFDQLCNEFYLMENVPEIKYTAGSIILSKDENPIGIGIVSNGKVLISTAVHGNASTLRSLSEGDTFGAASLFMKQRCYSTGVVSDGDSSVIYINTATVRILCKKIPAVAMNYIEFLSDRIAFLNTKVSTFSAQSSDARIAYYLYGLTGGEKKTAELTVSYSRLAEMLGMGRASLYRSLDSFCKKNIIKRTSKTVTVLDPEKLKKIYN